MFSRASVCSRRVAYLDKGEWWPTWTEGVAYPSGRQTTTLGGRPPPPQEGRPPPRRQTLPPEGRPPPPHTHTHTRSTGGRYASYWNSFLFKIFYHVKAYFVYCYLPTLGVLFLLNAYASRMAKLNSSLSRIFSYLLLLTSSMENPRCSKAMPFIAVTVIAFDNSPRTSQENLPVVSGSHRSNLTLGAPKILSTLIESTRPDCVK